ncbi:hypothetical protein PINS_up000449 [Pythium insidiosum]|nr:hypothetical protein PINS_up000449 [Pythium insidiosum]
MFLEQASIVITITYATFSAIYGFMAFRRIWVSLLHRELRFGVRTISRLRSSQFSGLIGTPRASVNSTFKGFSRVFPVHMPVSVSSRVHSWAKYITRFRSAVGVHGSLFDLRVMFDESIELISQTISAFSASRSISNLYLNQSYGVVIFLSGVSGVVIHHIYRGNLAKQRTARLLSDLALDFVWGSILPLWMYLPLLRAYYSQAGLEASIEESQSSAREVERILVLSWGSFALSIIPFLNSFLVILELQDILFEVQAASPFQVSTVASGVSSHSHSHNERRRSSRTVIKLRAPHKSNSHTTSNSHQAWDTSFLSRLFHIVVAVYGTLIFAVSIAASGIFHRHSTHVQLSKCDSRVYPWFTTKDACLTRVINCSMEGIVGNETELTTIIDAFDEQSLADLKFVDCPALEIPRAIHRFSRIQSLILDKSTVVKWETSAGLQSEFFPELRTIKLISVEVGVVPLGLTAVPVTTSIEWMRIVNTNATDLLAAVGSSWAFVVYFDCDYCAIDSVPLAVDTMHRLLTLSLVGNDITNVSDTWIHRWDIKLVGLWLNENSRLRVLPDEVWRQATTCNIFFLQQTNISVIPEWLPSLVGPTFQIYGFGSPMCSTSSSPMPPEYRVVNCDFQSN